MMSIIHSITGRALPLRGDDLDTDRIMPARFLRSVTFENLEQHLFEDDRATNPAHAFSNPRYAGATILVVNRNFGCGSSREHAPQGLARFGIRAIIGESFSEIFQGNAVMLGLPCFTTDRAAIDGLQSLIEGSPGTIVDARVDTGVITAGSAGAVEAMTMTASLPPASRDSFLSGQWNPTAMLLDRFDEVKAVASRLPYVRGF